ncbi:unnamed protein product [Lactuca virosa]|uniref:Uncharacterized protein n=1 Tax=Lactuca virosa TaxID=75947 RepID=A0AAU9P3H5_9ASTR|nr:unnamed protein product [Lactuca virosa]
MLAPSHVIFLALIGLPLINALTGPSDYLSGKPDFFLVETSLHCVPFDFPITMTGMGDDMYAVASEVDCCMLEQYTHEYHLFPVLGFQVPSSSSSVL